MQITITTPYIKKNVHEDKHEIEAAMVVTTMTVSNEEDLKKAISQLRNSFDFFSDVPDLNCPVCKCKL